MTGQPVRIRIIVIRVPCSVLACLRMDHLCFVSRHVMIHRLYYGVTVLALCTVALGSYYCTRTDAPLLICITYPALAFPQRDHLCPASGLFYVKL